MKQCNMCQQLKPEVDFYRATGQCIPCKNAKDAGRRRECRDLSGKNSTDAARARKRKWQRENRDPAKESARRQVREAITAGTLVRPECCQDCGNTARRRDGKAAIQAHHHEGYDRPLDVQWLCPKCHREHDAARAGGSQ